MVIGLDFDNTIVCYDDVFHRAAVEQGLIPATLPLDKNSVRNFLRADGREDDWTRLQGYVYGVAISGAQPYPGVFEFLEQSRRHGAEVVIVSHKTRHPVLGEPYDLHRAAGEWLRAQGFFDTARTGLSAERAHFELTATAKRDRIGRCACAVFIDDLPEFLDHPDFPTAVDRMLFDPAGKGGGGLAIRAVRSWHEAADRLWSTSASSDA